MGGRVMRKYRFTVEVELEDDDAARRLMNRITNDPDTSNLQVVPESLKYQYTYWTNVPDIEPEGHDPFAGGRTPAP